jgi:hypothetical protein
MGRFNGLSDAQWKVIESQLPKEPEKRGKGYPHAPWRSICNTILLILESEKISASVKALAIE